MRSAILNDDTATESKRPVSANSSNDEKASDGLNPIVIDALERATYIRWCNIGC
jgi:hypothetical protein